MGRPLACATLLPADARHCLSFHLQVRVQSLHDNCLVAVISKCRWITNLPLPPLSHTRSLDCHWTTTGFTRDVSAPWQIIWEATAAWEANHIGLRLRFCHQLANPRRAQFYDNFYCATNTMFCKTFGSHGPAFLYLKETAEEENEGGRGLHQASEWKNHQKMDTTDTEKKHISQCTVRHTIYNF